jgi:hypothetical protein
MLPTLVPEPNTDFDFYGTDNRYFMPRVGLAYRLSDKWVIRSGGGWFVNVQQMNNMTILDLQPPYSGTFGFNQVTDLGQVIPDQYGGQTYNIQTRKFRPGSSVLTLDEAFPGQGTAAARTNVLLFTPDNRASSVWQWSFDIQRELPANVFLTVAYVGSKTSHIDNTVSNFNAPDPSPDTDINRRRPYQAYVSRGEGDQARLLGNIRYLDSFANGNYTASSSASRSATAAASRLGSLIRTAKLAVKATVATILPATSTPPTKTPETAGRIVNAMAST